jgi:DNA (cytosine-5)-methyltransferase 1
MQRVKLPDGRRRRIVQREAARLQSFPDWFEFCGNETQQFTQIGNAVPPLLAYQLALAVKETFHKEERSLDELHQINQIFQPLFAEFA